MASLYRRNNSPFWWVKFRDSDTGKIVRQSTRYRIGVGTDLAKARKFAAEKSLAERTSHLGRKDGWGWVDDYFAQIPNALSRGRKMAAWRHISTYLTHRRITQPHQLRREDCLAYPPWRLAKRHPVRRNTAIYELIVLQGALTEATRRGILEVNPCRNLGLKRDSVRIKPEMTDHEIELIRQAITQRLNDPVRQQNRENATVDHFLRVSFEIAIHQGCRLSETHLDLHRQVNLDMGEITFHAKGDTYYTTKIHPGLVPLLRELRDAGRTHTYDFGSAASWPGMNSVTWSRFLHSLGLKHLSFHSTRVTVISRMERAGAPESVVMRLVGHASTTVHAVYRRFTNSELRQWWPSLTPKTPPPDGA